ncbi:TetR/AcrR family transcriptional regulator [Leeia aquatica]|uniref:TetR/AcrR family transcriptional regulator n=1 Tax=Leeia aquatica TaxID=2725557 RepID=A0A847S9K0_9NEIS|nr:TetR/AcrR family transcriptional regulator [Leeia aquatica]NLR74029.1 TetR/AcrR family transcriptional regulator [Leeia aquatica]
MKVSEQEKQQTRLRLLEAAVAVVTDKGFRQASMREIAERAGVGSATIYNYFPTKESLLYGYCAHVQQQVQAALQAIPDFHEYSLSEQLQQLVETELQAWLPAREFLQEVFRLTFHSPVASHLHLDEARQHYVRMVEDMLAAAIEAGEIPEQAGLALLAGLFWDFQTAVLAYWLRDGSEQFSQTSAMLDRAMAVIAGILETALVGKAMELVSFLFRTHVLSHLDRARQARQTLHKRKRRFMGVADE